MPGRMSARRVELSGQLEWEVNFSGEFVRTTGSSMSKSKYRKRGFGFHLTHYY